MIPLLLAALAAGWPGTPGGAVGLGRGWPASDALPVIQSYTAGGRPLPAPVGAPSDALSRATWAAKTAWALVKDLEKRSEANTDYVPLIEEEIARAEEAARRAKEEDEKLTELLNQTRESAGQAALEAAEDFYMSVKEAGARAIAEAAEQHRAAAERAEVKAAKEAATAAMPYHAMLMRGQKAVMDYQHRAQALATASNILKSEGQKLAASANQYQATGYAAQASQIMATARAVVNQAGTMTQEAERLHATASKVNEALPYYQMAERSAADSAAAAANALTVPVNFVPY